MDKRETVAWVLANVPPGAVVAVSGTARGTGYRRVLGFSRNAMGIDVMLGQHLRYGYRYAADGRLVEYLSAEGRSLRTEHSVHNVSHVILRAWPVADPQGLQDDASRFCYEKATVSALARRGFPDLPHPIEAVGSLVCQPCPAGVAPVPEVLAWLRRQAVPGALALVQDGAGRQQPHVILGWSTAATAEIRMHSAPLLAQRPEVPGGGLVASRAVLLAETLAPGAISGFITHLRPQPDGGWTWQQGRLDELVEEDRSIPLFGHLLYRASVPDGYSAQSSLVDIVDAMDRPLACGPRDLVHRAGLLHRFVHVLVQRQDGRLLLQRRSMRKQKGPGLFDASVGGHVDAGESYELAMRRESAEELGLDAGGDYRLLGDVRDDSPGVENMLGKLYLHVSDGPFSGWQDEADQLEWFTREELAAMTGRFPYLFTGGMLSSARLILQQD